MADYTVIDKPTRIEAPGGKLIEEYVGRVQTQASNVSVAHMVAPPGWSEPSQTPEFEEITVMVRGTMRIEVGDDVVELKAGQAITIQAGVRVRYGNPYDEENEYYAVCLPAFSPDLVHRTVSE